MAWISPCISQVGLPRNSSSRCLLPSESPSLTCDVRNDLRDHERVTDKEMTSLSWHSVHPCHADTIGMLTAVYACRKLVTDWSTLKYKPDCGSVWINTEQVDLTSSTARSCTNQQYDCPSRALTLLPRDARSADAVLRS